MFEIVVLARKKLIGISLPQNISIQLSSRDWVDRSRPATCYADYAKKFDLRE